MKKILSIMLTVCVLCAMLSFSAHAYVREIDVYVSGKPLVCDVSPRLISDTTYVPLRAMADALGAEYVSWDDSKKTAYVGYNGYEISVPAGEKYIEANGRCFYSVNECIIIESRIFVPIRAFASAFCADTEWNGSEYSVNVTKSGRKLSSGSAYYNSEDLYWLSRIISAESSGEVLDGKIAVGNVVLNRRWSREYPDTVYDVVFDRKYGVQFSPVASGTVYNAPTADSVRAAKICLEGYSLDDSALYFMNAAIATSMWIKNNRPYAFTIGSHSFYY